MSSMQDFVTADERVHAVSGVSPLEEVVAPGEKIHVVSRKLFKEDVRRHFAGVVTAVNAAQTVVRAEGFTFVFEPMTAKFLRREDVRCRVICLTDPAYNIVVLPEDVTIRDLRYMEHNGRLIVTDGRFRMDVNEFGPNF